MESSLVSILVPVFGVERYIQRCAESLFNQTYKNIEYIFVDDRGIDDSVQILRSTIKQYPNRKKQVRILENSENKGLAFSRKRALLESSGNYILHVDSDDWIEPNTVELLVNEAEETLADVVVFDLKHVYPNKEILERNDIGQCKEDYLRMLLYRQTSVNLVTKLFKRELCVRDDTLPIPGLNYSEDFAVLPRIMAHARKIVKLNKALYNYNHFSETSYSNSVKRKSIDNFLGTISLLTDFFNKNGVFENSSYILDCFRAINRNVMLSVCDVSDISYVLEHMPGRLGIKVSDLPLKHWPLYLWASHSCKWGIMLYKYIRNKRYN